MLFDDEQLQLHEFELYKRWLSYLERTSTKLSAIIYVDTDPETCLSRIKLRSRDGEDCIPIEYLNKLDHYQSTWINSETIPCLRSIDVEEISQFVNNLLNQNDININNNSNNESVINHHDENQNNR